MPELHSSCLACVEYDSGILYLGFCNGASYTLCGVPIDHYYGLLNASSPGWYFNTYLRGRY